jgi:hypothetical protein
MARELPDPLGPLSRALERVLGRLLCIVRPCRWGPHYTSFSQWDAKLGLNILKAEFSCVRCGRKRVIPFLRAERFIRRHRVWENYR